MIIEGFSQNTSTVLASPTWASTTSTTPGFAYPGGKKRIRNSIVSFMPKSGSTYAEPFAGRANVFWLAATTLQFSNWWLNDLRTAPFLHAIISHGSTLEVPEHTRQEFERQKAVRHTGDPIAILLEPYLSYSGAGYAASYRPTKGAPLRHHYQNTLRCAHQIMLQTQPTITNLDWKLVVADLNDDDFAYVDPPYAAANVHGYGPDDIDHIEMVSILKNARFRWLLSEYYQPIYVEAFGEPIWRKEVQLCSTNFRHDGGKEKRIECLWRNY
jgi:site-specific DNA-adenine methylase